MEELKGLLVLWFVLIVIIVSLAIGGLVAWLA
ncbi:hypothetical protein HRbin25_00120 [bacterium HR25]|jgi:uncharacterized membrane protein YqiK|nr:hypothetical protein HRbin25_00120 [bacterium HR25]